MDKARSGRRLALLGLALLLLSGCDLPVGPGSTLPPSPSASATPLSLVELARARIRALHDPVPDPGSSAAPTRLTVVRMPGSTALPPLNRTFVDPSLVRPIYAALLAEPPIPPDIGVTCPPDNGVQWHLEFVGSARLILTANASANGCQFVRMQPASDRRAREREFWFLLAQALGLTIDDMHPQ
ncbi:MAG TPA: hypothetical protein VET65_10945 [Candidatus Limnocylindrales bacterium]|nr:hypothetical protein [Candidatus Limnocylindrales bacterium]